jgi:hypothetical protein
MDAVPVNICYRPLRIAWAIRPGDWEAFRQAVRLSHACWGGRFNPIVFIDEPEETDRIINLYRADLVWPLGGHGQDVDELLQRHKHRRMPMFPAQLFYDTRDNPKSTVLDVLNQLVHLGETPEWKRDIGSRLRRYVWDPAEPLRDVFLIHFGAYPDPQIVGLDYLDLVSRSLSPTEVVIRPGEEISADVLDYPHLAYLSRHGLVQHHSIWGGRSHTGYFVGDATNLEDLVCFWNLRAADIQLQFVDPNHRDRFQALMPVYRQRFGARLEGSDQHGPQFAVWSRGEITLEMCELVGGNPVLGCRVTEYLWNGLNLRPPVMILGEASALGVVSRSDGAVRVSFSLNNKPFASNVWFHTQHLVASVDLGGSAGDENITFEPPFVPELNEHFGRAMNVDPFNIRAEPGRLGVVVDAHDHDVVLKGLSTRRQHPANPSMVVSRSSSLWSEISRSLTGRRACHPSPPAAA